MTITYPDFLKTAQQNAGEDLPTAGGRKWFRLEESTHGVRFTPRSSGKPRPLNQKDIQNYLDVFNRTQSTETHHYGEKMYNLSYVLAIIKLWQSQLADAPLLNDGTTEAGGINPEFSAPEGDLKVRSHQQRERSRDLVALAKAPLVSG